MVDTEIQETSTPQPKISLPENDFDKLQKNYPNYKDKTNFLNDPKFSDIKETLAKTINTLAQEKITTPDEVFWNNIQKVTEEIFWDPIYQIDKEQKETDAQNIFLFRTKFEEIQKKSIITTEESTNTQTQKENTEIMTKNSEMRTELDKKYQQVDIKYKSKNDQELMDFKNQARFADLIKKIKENEPDSNKQEEKINKYFKHLFAVEQVINEANKPENKKQLSKDNYEFIKQFVSLNENLGIENTIDLTEFTIIDENPEPDNTPPEKKGSTERSMEKIVHNENLWTDLVKNNENIENFVLDTETNTLDNKVMEADQDIKKVIDENIGTWYGTEIQIGIEQLLEKNKLEKYNDNFDNGKMINADKIPEKDKEKLEKISAKVIDIYTAKAQERILKDTNKIIKTKAIAALLQNIGQYFKVDNLAQDFTIDMKSGIEFDQKELKLSGSMDGRDMTFYYDMNSWELFADDFVHYNAKDKTFYINRGNQDSKGREKLPLKMPTLKDTVEESQTAFTKAMPKALENTDNLNEYGKELNETRFTLDKKSNVADIVIEHSMAKNIAIQETQEFLEDYMPIRGEYSKDKEIREYNLYNIMDTSFDRYTSEEIDTRRKTLKTFGEKINPEKQHFKDGMLKSLFSDENIGKDIDTKYDTMEWPSIYRFFDAITYDQVWTDKDYVIDLTAFWEITNQLTKEEGTTENIPGQSKKYKKLWNDFNEAKETTNLDKEILDNPARESTK